MTNLEMYKIFQPLIKKACGVPHVIYADQNAPAPSGPYCAIQFGTNVRQYAQAVQRRHVTDRRTIVTKYYRQLEVDCMINFYRAGALDYARKLIEFNHLQFVVDVMQRHKMGVRNISAVHNLTELFSGNMEERANVKMVVWYSDPIEDEVNTIEHAKIILETEEEVVLAEFDVDV